MALQEILFQRIREKLRPGTSLAEEVAARLHLSIDSAYRRIRGETPLVLEEAAELCSLFALSLDDLLGATENSVAFTRLAPGGDGIGSFLRQWLSELRELQSAGNRQLICFSKDLPLFHYFLFPELFAFRYYFWMKSILRHPDFLHRPYAPDIVPGEIRDLGRQIAEVYSTIPSVEVWNAESVNSVLVQLDFYWQAGYFASEEDWRGVCRALVSTLQHVQAEAEAGAKFLPGQSSALRPVNFELFHNRLVLADNTLLATVEGRNRAFISYDVVHFLVTTDEKFCAERLATLNDRIRHSTLLSRVSEKQRHMFFNHLIRKVPGVTSNTNRS